MFDADLQVRGYALSCCGITRRIRVLIVDIIVGVWKDGKLEMSSAVLIAAGLDEMVCQDDSLFRLLFRLYQQMKP